MQHLWQLAAAAQLARATSVLAPADINVIRCINVLCVSSELRE
jgi:hypothetical protein